VPRPVPVEAPTDIRVMVIDYERHKVVSCEEVKNHPTYFRFTAQCGISVDKRCEGDALRCDDRFDQSDQTVGCYGCGGT